MRITSLKQWRTTIYFLLCCLLGLAIGSILLWLATSLFSSSVVNIGIIVVSLVSSVPALGFAIGAIKQRDPQRVRFIVLVVIQLIVAVLTIIFAVLNNLGLALFFTVVAVIGSLVGKAGGFIWTVILLPILRGLPNTIFGAIARPWIDKGKQLLISRFKKKPSPEAGTKALPSTESENKAASTQYEMPPAPPESKPARVRSRAKQPLDTPEAAPAPTKRTRKRASPPTTTMPDETS